MTPLYEITRAERMIVVIAEASAAPGSQRRLPGSAPLVIEATGLAKSFGATQAVAGWLQAFVKINPVSNLVTAERGLIGGQAAAGQVAWVLLASAAMVTVFAPVTVYLCGRQC